MNPILIAVFILAAYCLGMAVGFGLGLARGCPTIPPPGPEDHFAPPDEFED